VRALSAQGHDDEALTWGKSAETLVERAGDVSTHVRLLQNIGRSLHKQRAFAASERHHERALALLESTAGERPSEAHNLMVADTLWGLGSVANAANQHTRALDFYTQAQRLLEETLGSEHPKVANLLEDTAAAYAAAQMHGEALRVYQRALGIQEGSYGPVHFIIGRSLYNTGLAYFETGDLEAAREHFRRALDTYDRLGEAARVYPLLGLGSVALELGVVDQAYAYYRSAFDTLGAERGDDDPMTNYARAGLGQAALERGAHAEALTLLSQALESAEKDGTLSLRELAWTRFGLARALWSEHRQRGRAVELAAAALAELEKAGEGSPMQATERAKIKAWLVEHRPR
jgi:tetratricopeptide (TPR) repeat protein